MPSVAEEPRYVTERVAAAALLAATGFISFLFFSQTSAEEDAAQTMSISHHHYGVCDAGHDGSPLPGS